MALVDRELAEQKARAWAGDGLNEDFLVLAYNRLSALDALGVTKEQVIKFLDPMVEAKKAQP
jgi:hypothetical protein